MAKAAKTTRKLPSKPFTGKEGNTFSAENQPDPSLKSAGWQEWRKERHLTQSIIKALTGENKAKFNDYIESLIQNAQAGNAKAIDAVNKCIEDEIIKVAQTNTAGEDVQPQQDLSKLTDDELRNLAELQRKSRISTP